MLDVDNPDESCMSLIINNSMLKLIFDKDHHDVKFLKEKNLTRQRWRLQELRVSFRFYVCRH